MELSDVQTICITVLLCWLPFVAWLFSVTWKLKKVRTEGGKSGIVEVERE